MWGYPEFYIPVPGGYGTESHSHLRRRARAAAGGARCGAGSAMTALEPS